MSSPERKLTESLQDRLRRRREEFGASLGDLASWSGLQERRLGEIEAGAELDAWEFEAACRGLAVDPGALARSQERSPRRSVARFRSAAWVEPQPKDFRTLALASEIGRIGGYLASELDHDRRLETLREAIPVNAREAPWKQGYRLGERARFALNLSSGPIIDLETSLRSWGVHVARVSFSSSYLDAASLWEEKSLPVILLNSGSGRTSFSLGRRALLAHELCHLLHDSGDRDLTTQLSWSEGVGNFAEKVEQRARGFAPAFLAPRDDVRSWFRAGEGRRIRGPEAKVEALARRWGFSLRGAVWHAKNCDLIPPRVAEALSKELVDEAHAWNDDFEQEVRQPDRDTASAKQVSDFARGLLVELVNDAVEAGLISEGRGHEVVTWS